MDDAGSELTGRARLSILAWVFVLIPIAGFGLVSFGVTTPKPSIAGGLSLHTLFTIFSGLFAVPLVVSGVTNAIIISTRANTLIRSGLTLSLTVTLSLSLSIVFGLSWLVCVVVWGDASATVGALFAAAVTVTSITVFVFAVQPNRIRSRDVIRDGRA